jgi:purine nucleosidase
MRVLLQGSNPLKPTAGLSGAPSRILSAILLVFCIAHQAPAQTGHVQPSEPKQLVIIDTDIGDDIDDAFAVGLAVQSPEFKILGITTAFGDTKLRAQLAVRMLDAVSREDIPVVAGVKTPPRTKFTQAEYAEGGDAKQVQPGSAPNFILDQIRKHPGEITLLAIGPQTNLGAAIDKDAGTFRKLKRIVMMGGSVYKGYKGGVPDPEWNILCDIPAAQKVFTSGVPLYVMPLDATILKLDEHDLKALFDYGSPLTKQIEELYREWGQPTPTLFDPMAVGYAANPELCPTTPLHLSVDDKGFTVPGPGTPNAQVCLKSDPATFFPFVLKRLEEKAPARNGPTVALGAANPAGNMGGLSASGK